MKPTVRIAALGDLHYGRNIAKQAQVALERVPELADVLVLCGDLTDTGTPEEARLLAKDLSSLGVPTLCVLGNHDYEAGQPQVVAEILTDAGVHVLDGEAVEVLGIGFAGVKGFGGGYGRGTLGPWGEPAIKAFVQEAVNEALKLEKALARLRTAHSVAILHYAPIRETCETEPPEILPYLGTSRLEEPLTRYQVDAVFHGHAHNGRLQGKTSNGVPVYNVSLPLLRKLMPDAPPFHLLEVPREPPSRDVLDQRSAFGSVS
ncbi:MAG TPA: metallophosphoesterase [Vicinamibacterales bacterium]